MSILAEENSKPWIGAVAVTLAAGVLYFLTAARDIVVGDTPELIMAAATLGVAHPPGYPLFTMLGHFFSVLPFGSIPFRVNLLSVVCDALAVGVIYFTAVRLTKSQLAAAIAALVLAVTSNFWQWSLAAEVFPLNNLLAAILILLLIAWHEQPDRGALLIAAFFVSGLASTNHQTIVLLGPAFCFVLWQRRSTLFARPSLFAICAVALLIGLLPYAYIPWAAASHPVYQWGHASSFRDLIDLIMRRSYGSTKLVSTAGYTGGPPWPRLGALAVSFGPVAGLLIILGAIEAFRRARWYFWFSLIAFVFSGPFFVWITNLSLAAPSALFVLERFFLLSQVALAPLAAFGAVALTRFVVRAANLTTPLAMRTVALICLVAIVVTVAISYRRVDLSRNHIARQLGEDIFKTTAPHSILLVSGDGVAFPLMYLQNVEHTGTDTTLVVIPLLPADWYVGQLREAHPELVIPFERYDPATNNLKQIVDANSNRTWCIAGTIGNEDRSLNQDYWPSQRGLLLVVQRKDVRISLQEEIDGNEPFFQDYHPPNPDSVRFDTFENDIISMYAWPSFRIGNDCLSGGFQDDARKWYERALAINPNFAQAHSALARLEH